MFLKLLQELQFLPFGLVAGVAGLGTGIIWRRVQSRARRRVQAAVAAYLALQNSQRTV